MEVVEIFLSGKRQDEHMCEDDYIITGSHAVVIDGVSSRTSSRYDGKTTGKIATECIKKAVSEYDDDITLEEAIASINTIIQSTYNKLDIYDLAMSKSQHRFTANLIIYSDYFKEIWSIGDCQCLVDQKYYRYDKKVDILFAELRAFLLEHAIKDGNTEIELLKDDFSRSFINDLIRKQLLFENARGGSPYNYFFLDGFHDLSNEVEVLKVSGCSEIVLATDGYPKLYNTLEATEEYLEFILDKDPLCYKLFKSTKGVTYPNDSFDDRCYLRLTV